MGLLGVKRSGDCSGDDFHQFSVLSPSDFSVSQNLVLPFDKDESVYGGSCGDVVYFYSNWGKTVIYNLQNNQFVIDVVPPPELLAPNYDANPSTRRRSGMMKSCGVSYGAESRDYKVLRIYHQEEDYTSCYFDLYSMLSRSTKGITGPSRKCLPKMGATSIYVGEAGSGSGNCYWLARLCYDADGYALDHPLLNHVLSFDFATERFDQFPLPAPASPAFELVRCRGSLGVLVYWTPFDEFSVDGCQCSPRVDCRCFPNLTIRLFVRNGKGTSWDLLYDVSVADGYEPIGLKDDRVLFIAATPRGGCYQLMVYYLASNTLKKLDIYTRDHRVCGIAFGDKKKKKKNKNKNKKNNGKGKG